MKIFVTGCSGYIGGTFSYEALKKGHIVYGLDNFVNSKRDVIEKISSDFQDNFLFEQIDIATDAKDLDKFLMKSDPDVVVHFAGLKAVGESEKQPLAYWENNLMGTLNLIKSMQKSKTKSIVFSSSATVYGNSKVQPVDEDSYLNTTSTYGSTKLSIEYLLNDVSRTGALNVISLRYFNPVGAHKEKIIFEDPFDSPNNLMPRIVRVALGIDKEIGIFGSDYSTKDGTGERDYIHIEDLVQGHFHAVEYLEDFNGFASFNLGTGNKVSVLDLIKTFEESNKITIPYKHEQRRQGDVEICYADPSKSNQALNWRAKRSTTEMCIDTWEAIKKNINEIG
tara:strand:- start:254 stop:1264 length:1011 start_codon:yes stop_codon:yes gene_type:complete